MYNNARKRYQLDYKSGIEITITDIQNIIADHRNNITPVMKKLENYANGYNTKIKEKDNTTDSSVPNNTKCYAYGKRIVDTTTNYLISNNAKYFAKDQDYLQTIENIQLVNDDARETKEIIYDLVRFGIAGKLFYYEQEDNKPVLKYAYINPQEFVPIYDYSVNPKLIAVIRYYTTLDSAGANETTNVSVYNEDNEQVYIGSNSESYTLKETIPHAFDTVPFAVYGGGDYSGMLYHVLDQIDAYDLLQNSNLNEVEKNSLAIMVFSDGVEVTAEGVKKANELGAWVAPTGMTAKDAVAYLTKEINSDFHNKVGENGKQEIFDLSNVPDFMSKEFAADSGVALRFKLIGFDNSAKQIEEFFKYGESRAIDIMTKSFDGTWKSRGQYYYDNPDRIVKVELIENIPNDTSIQLQNATILKGLGVDPEVWVNALPTDLIGNDKAAIIEQINKNAEKEIDKDFIQIDDEEISKEEVE